MIRTNQISKALLLVLSILLLSTALKIDSISIDKTQESAKLEGSVFGGTTIYIKGTGFNSDASKNTVMVGDYLCDIPSEGVTDATLACQTGSTGKYSNLYNQPISVNV